MMFRWLRSNFTDLEEEREKWVGGTEFIIGFEGSQPLPVCPSGKCKHITGTIEV
jgi:hypothetical protein